MTPDEVVAATKQTVQKSGGAFMLHPDSVARAREARLDPFPWYFAGRCGVLGDVSADVAVAAMVFFPAAHVGPAWARARAVLAPQEAVEAFAASCQGWGRAHLAEAEGLAGFCALAERVVGAADVAGLPLFAGWRDVALPDDPPARAAQLLHVLREHRGGLHGLAVLAAGMTPLEAVVSGPHGPDNARFLGWPAPYPDPGPLAAARAEVEATTDRLAARAYAVLDAAERAELAAACAAVKASAVAVQRAAARS